VRVGAERPAAGVAYYKGPTNMVFVSIATPSSMIGRCWLIPALAASWKLSSSKRYTNTILERPLNLSGFFFCQNQKITDEIVAQP